MCEKILNRYGFEDWRTILIYKITEKIPLLKKIFIFSLPYISYALAIYLLSIIC